MARRHRHEEHQNHEAWAIPYGDLLTLLLAFFVVMYAMSSVNEGKYRVLSDSLNEAFHGTPRSPEPLAAGHTRMDPIEQLPLTQVNRMITAALPLHRFLADAVIHPQQPSVTTGTGGGGTESPHGRGNGREVVLSSPFGPSDSTTTLPTSAPDARGAGADGGNALDRVASDVSAALGPLLKSGLVRVHRTENAVTVDISTDILFASGDARLAKSAVSVLQRLADVLKRWPNTLRVEGYTDDRPINTRAFPSNWELSAARAASVVHLFMDRGIAPPRLSVMGYGEYRPAEPNATAAGRNANRRVQVVIVGNATQDAPSSSAAGRP